MGHLLTAQRQQPGTYGARGSAPPHRSVPAVIKDTVAAISVTLSLWSIFYAALPGLGGLISFGAAGVRIGYQLKPTPGSPCIPSLKWHVSFDPGRLA